MLSDSVAVLEMLSDSVAVLEMLSDSVAVLEMLSDSVAVGIRNSFFQKGDTAGLRHSTSPTER